MSRNPKPSGQLPWLACEGHLHKLHHRTRAQAKAHAHMLGGDPNVFRCTGCHLWFVGNPRGSVARLARAGLTINRRRRSARPRLTGRGMAT